MGYRNTTNTAVPPYCICQTVIWVKISVRKKQFIGRVNKLEVFILYVDDILVQLVSNAAALCLLAFRSGTVIPLRDTPPIHLSDRADICQGKSDLDLRSRSEWLSLCSADFKVLRHGSHRFACNKHHTCLYLVNVHQMAPPPTEVQHLIAAYYSDVSSLLRALLFRYWYYFICILLVDVWPTQHIEESCVVYASL